MFAYAGYEKHTKFEYWLADYHAIRKKRKVTLAEPKEFILKEMWLALIDPMYADIEIPMRGDCY